MTLKEKARELQARTGWSYSECFRCVRDLTHEQIEELIAAREPKPEAVTNGNEFDCKGGCRRRTANLSGTCTDCQREGCGQIVMGPSGDCVCPTPEHHAHLVAQSRLRFDKAQGRLTPPLRVEHPFSLDIPVYAPEHVESRISAVVRGFDFASVHRCMELLRWTWGDGLGSHGVPTIDSGLI